MGSDTTSKDDIAAAVESEHVLDDGNANKNEGICECINHMNYFCCITALFSRNITIFRNIL